MLHTLADRAPALAFWPFPAYIRAIPNNKSSLCGGRKTAAGQKRWSFIIFTSASHLEPVFEPVIEKAGFRLVRLRIMGGQSKTLQIMAERADGSMDVEGCTILSHVLLDFIEAEDPIEGEYEIEVSSPGIDRPLTRLTDFSRWKGHEAKVELTAPVPTANGERKRFRGLLEGLDGNDVVIATDGQRIVFPFRSVLEAKLVLTDKLIQEDLKARKSA